MEKTAIRLGNEANDILKREKSLVSTIKQYIREHGNKIEMPDNWEGEERELMNTPMAVMDDYESWVDTYIEGVSMTENGDITIWGNRTDGNGYVDAAVFDTYANAVDLAAWLLQLKVKMED